MSTNSNEDKLATESIDYVASSILTKKIKLNLYN
jgi:hypothetical protein